MNKQEFLSICEELARTYLDCEVERELSRQQYPHKSAYSVPKTELRLDAFHASWETGGMGGGSCWGTEATAYACNEPEAELHGLTALLETHFQAITYLAFRKVESKITRWELVDGGYYGNHTDYAVKSLKFEAIWDVLAESGLVSED